MNSPKHPQTDTLELEIRAAQFAAEYFCYPEAEEFLEEKLKLLEAAFIRGAEWQKDRDEETVSTLLEALKFYAGCPMLTSADRFSFDSGSFQEDRGSRARAAIAKAEK